MLQLAHDHETNKRLRLVVKEACQYARELEINLETFENIKGRVTKQAKKIKQHTKKIGQQHLEDQWSQKIYIFPLTLVMTGAF